MNKETREQEMSLGFMHLRKVFVSLTISNLCQLHVLNTCIRMAKLLLLPNIITCMCMCMRVCVCVCVAVHVYDLCDVGGTRRRGAGRGGAARGGAGEGSSGSRVDRHESCERDTLAPGQRADEVPGTPLNLAMLHPLSPPRTHTTPFPPHSRCQAGAASPHIRDIVNPASRRTNAPQVPSEHRITFSFTKVLSEQQRPAVH